MLKEFPKHGYIHIIMQDIQEIIMVVFMNFGRTIEHFYYNYLRQKYVKQVMNIKTSIHKRGTPQVDYVDFWKIVTDPANHHLGGYNH